MCRSGRKNTTDSLTISADQLRELQPRQRGINFAIWTPPMMPSVRLESMFLFITCLVAQRRDGARESVSNKRSKTAVGAHHNSTM